MSDDGFNQTPLIIQGFEFKLNQTAGIALEQIREEEYFRKYQHSGRKIILVGANFDTVSRQITEWKSEIVC